MIVLSKRLKAIAELIPHGAYVADIGSDHGFLPIYLAENQIAKRIIASDIASGPIDSARKNAVRYSVADKISFITAPGLSGIVHDEVDNVVISGMGGETIIDIIKCSDFVKNNNIRLILQPQSKTEELCRFLCRDGYSIQNASLVEDSGRIYLIMCCLHGDNILSADPFMALLESLKSASDPLFLKYMDMLIIKERRKLEGQRRAGIGDDTRLEHLLRLSDKNVKEAINAES